MRYKLDEVWTPIRNDIKSSIKTNYEAITDDTLTDTEAGKIEAMIYNYTHTLRKCYMLFDEEATLVDLQTLLKETINHKVFALVNEWKLICSTLKIDTGKFISQDSFYDVADTPHVEHKEFSELDVKSKQAEALYNHSQAIRECYNEIKMMVQTIY